MGPRSCDRGKGDESSRGLGALLASMGPRSCDRGKSAPPMLATAPALLLQWGRGHATAESTSGTVVRRHHSQASMGPRSCDRGKKLRRGQGRRGRHASMGPRSCDRGKNRRGKPHKRGKCRLQWGRGHATAESNSAKLHSNHLIVASMGPRSCDRGKQTGKKQVPDHAVASMGPRSCDRGKLSGESGPRPPRGCFNGAAVMRPRKVWAFGGEHVGRNLLQWGRGHATAERGADSFV